MTSTNESSTEQRPHRRVRIWRTLEPWARVSLVGLGVSAILALALAWYIPHQVEEVFLQSMADANEDLTLVLISSTTGNATHELDVEFLDSHVTELIERDRFIRTKLWSVDGLILYSDEKRLVGEHFVPDEDFVNMTGAEWHISDLTAEENRYERDLGADRLLETYVPIFDGDEVGSVWEVYESLEEFDEAIATVQRNVWLAVGIGLVTLAGFLAAAFGALITTAENRRSDAENRSKELQDLLELARLSRQTVSSKGFAEEAVEFLIRDDDVTGVCLVRLGDNGYEVLARSGDLDDLGADRLETNRAQDEPIEADPGVSHVHSENYRLWVSHSDAPVHRTDTALQAMLEEVAVGIDKARLYEELEANRAHIELIMERMLEAQEEERRTTVAEIHDGLAQDLYRVLFGIRGCLNSSEQDTTEELVRLEELVADSSRQLRRLLQEIHPSVVDDVGLAASLQTLAERTEAHNDMQVELHIGMFTEPEYEKRMALFRIAQEALVNSVKHSGSNQASMAIFQRNGAIVLAVTDEGEGIDDEDGDGLGMWIMKERAEAQGGIVSITSSSSGTTVEVSIPNEVDDANN